MRNRKRQTRLRRKLRRGKRSDSSRRSKAREEFPFYLRFCCLWSSSKPSPAKLHRPKSCDGENVAGDMGVTYASVSCRRKSRLEQIADWFRAGHSRAARIELFDRLDR